jgi:hypothetical protein
MWNRKMKIDADGDDCFLWAIVVLYFVIDKLFGRRGG